MTPRLIYWDSCAFLHLLQKTPEYIEALEDQIERAKAGACKIVTSSVTLGEVSKISGSKSLPEEQSATILKFFENDYIKVFQADRPICEDAHHLARLHRVKPFDAIHLATAISAKVDLVVTTDGKKNRRDGLLQHDGRIGNPPLKICKPDLGITMPLFSAENIRRQEASDSEEEGDEQ